MVRIKEPRSSRAIYNNFPPIAPRIAADPPSIVPGPDIPPHLIDPALACHRIAPFAPATQPFAANPPVIVPDPDVPPHLIDPALATYRITPFSQANQPFDYRGLEPGDADIRQGVKVRPVRETKTPQKYDGFIIETPRSKREFDISVFRIDRGGLGLTSMAKSERGSISGFNTPQKYNKFIIETPGSKRKTKREIATSEIQQIHRLGLFSTPKRERDRIGGFNTPERYDGLKFETPGPNIATSPFQIGDPASDGVVFDGTRFEMGWDSMEEGSFGVFDPPTPTPAPRSAPRYGGPSCPCPTCVAVRDL